MTTCVQVVISNVQNNPEPLFESLVLMIWIVLNVAGGLTCQSQDKEGR